MSLIRESLEYIYCSNLVSNHVLIRLIRFISRFSIYFYNAIYFSIIFNTPYKRFTQILCFDFTASKHGRSIFPSPFHGYDLLCFESVAARPCVVQLVGREGVRVHVGFHLHIASASVVNPHLSHSAAGP